MKAWFLAVPGNLWHFLLDFKIGLDLGRTWRKSFQVARIMYGVR
jgi:hypothetical protein